MKYREVADAVEKAHKRLAPFWSDSTPWEELSDADRWLIAAAAVETIDVLYHDLDCRGGGID